MRWKVSNGTLIAEKNFCRFFGAKRQADIAIKRGTVPAGQYLGLDSEGDPLWALDLCSKRYALQREKHLSQQPEPVAV